MQMPVAEDTAASVAHAAAIDREPLAAFVALGAKLRSPEDLHRRPPRQIYRRQMNP
jgi:hypothetical protein